MIIRELDFVVGKLDDNTLKLTDVKSARLQELVDNLRNNGLPISGPGEVSAGEPKNTIADVFSTLPFEADNIGAIEHELLVNGFEVQTA